MSHLIASVDCLVPVEVKPETLNQWFLTLYTSKTGKEPGIIHRIEADLCASGRKPGQPWWYYDQGESSINI